MNPRLIRVVVSQFDEMQGLRTVAAGLMLLLFSWVASLPIAGSGGGAVKALAMCVPTVFAAWARPAVRDYYTRRFGRAVNGENRWGPELVFLAWIFGAFMLPLLVWRPAPLLWALWAAYPVYLVWRAWPYRLQHLLTAAAGAYVAWSRATVTPISDAELFREVWLLGAALIAGGLVDHLVLTRAMPAASARLAPDEI